ncbi:hypothetical protein B0I35DRAFT_131690 [Stachybotrys elegans]|uniref:Uncharacterized protein n=1 Tax=Stachybotrys elegans TaxID=80388 RepID=A0A8K0WV48_9HYPO|nr:hypothetical protein B0I35DRAFT_131690 [Stachybotrys elegans]
MIRKWCKTRPLVTNRRRLRVRTSGRRCAAGQYPYRRHASETYMLGVFYYEDVAISTSGLEPCQQSTLGKSWESCARHKGERSTLISSALTRDQTTRRVHAGAKGAVAGDIPAASSQTKPAMAAVARVPHTKAYGAWRMGLGSGASRRLWSTDRLCLSQKVAANMCITLLGDGDIRSPNRLILESAGTHNMIGPNGQAGSSSPKNLTSISLYFRRLKHLRLAPGSRGVLW